jgi:hypothetical protein
VGFTGFVMLSFVAGLTFGGVIAMALTIWATSFQGLRREEEFKEYLEEIHLLRTALKNIREQGIEPCATMAQDVLKLCRISKAEKPKCPTLKLKTKRYKAS